jgi:hypothetical protein
LAYFSSSQKTPLSEWSILDVQSPDDASDVASLVNTDILASATQNSEIGMLISP